MKKIIQTTIFLCVVVTAPAQTEKAPAFLEADMSFTWKVDSIFVNGFKLKLTAQNANSAVQLNKDHSCKNINNDDVETGTWQYNDSLKTIVIKLEAGGDAVNLELLQLGKTAMVAILKADEIKDEMKLYLSH